MMRKLAALVAVLTAVGVMGGTASAASGTEHFLLRLDDLNGTPTVVASGLINATGRDVSVSNRRDRFVFPQGNLVIEHHATSTEEHFNPATCTTRVDEDGAYRIVRGTGKYEGTSGSGTYEATIVQVGCDPSNPTEFHVTLRASGPISID
jgi:hypothetical protein